MTKVEIIEENLRISEIRVRRSKRILVVAIVGVILILAANFVDAAEGQKYGQIPNTIESIPVQNEQVFDLRALEGECTLIFLPRLCKRFVRAGKEAFMMFDYAISVMLKDGLIEANRELERMLNDLENGMPVTKQKGQWL